MVKVVFFGTERESSQVLGKLIENGIEIIAVVTKPDSPRGRGQIISSPAIKKLAQQRGIPVVQPEKLTRSVILNLFQDPDKQSDNISGFRIESGMTNTIGVLVSYGKIVPKEIIDSFPHGIINIHPSLLPKYRGPSPIETAIANGDSETGVSLMSLSPEMDAGPIYVQEKLALSGKETKPTLYEKLFSVGSDLLINNIDKIISGGLKPVPQDNAHASYTKLLNKNDGVLDPTTMTASECERKVRAYLGFPRTRIPLLGQEVIITGAKVLPDFTGDNWPDVIKCADDTYLQITEVISPHSGKQMKTADYLRGLHAQNT